MVYLKLLAQPFCPVEPYRAAFQSPRSRLSGATANGRLPSNDEPPLLFQNRHPPFSSGCRKAVGQTPTQARRSAPSGGHAACSRRSATAPGLTALCRVGKQQAARSVQKRIKSLQHSSITSMGTLRYLSVSTSHRRCWVADPRRLRVHRAGAGAGATSTATSGHTSVQFDAAERSCRRLRSCSIEVAAPFPNQMRDTRFFTWL